MYRVEEGSQSNLHNPRSRAASSSVAKTTGATDGKEIGGESGKELPPELVVSEDQEVKEGKTTAACLRLHLACCRRGQARRGVSCCPCFAQDDNACFSELDARHCLPVWVMVGIGYCWRTEETTAGSLSLVYLLTLRKIADPSPFSVSANVVSIAGQISLFSRSTQTGELKRSTYWDYIREAAGVWQVVLIFISMAGGQVTHTRIMRMQTRIRVHDDNCDFSVVEQRWV